MFNAFGNATQVPAANWRDEPATRGTWNILSTSLVTLCLCLWTALHLNIQGHKEGVWRQAIRKTGWLLLGLLAPEMLAYTAWYQHRAAHKLNAEMRRGLGQHIGHTRAQRLATFFTRCCRCHQGGADYKTGDVKLNNHEMTDIERDALRSRAAVRRPRWTTAHSFYAIMGGFVFDTSDEDINFLPNSRERLTLTPSGLLYLLEHEPDLIPNISTEQICDKSKANNLAKTIVCLQALWFCIQCIVRLAQGLAVSLLELNVFGHAICAILMYFLWWDKPLDIEEPTVVSGNMAREMCALMCMRSYIASGVESAPELPGGVRYGSNCSRNIAETSVKPDKEYIKIRWYRLDKIVVIVAIFIWNATKRSHGLESKQKNLECRLEWTTAGSVNEQPKSFCQHTAYPIDLNYPGDVGEPEDQTMSPSLPTAPLVVAENGFHAQNVGMRSIQHLPLGLPINLNRLGIDGLCLKLGEWYPSGGGKFVPRRQQPDYAPVSVTLFQADIIRWRLCARALQRYCPRPQWILKSDVPSHQEFPAYRSVYDRSPNWPSSQHFELTKVDRYQERFIFFGFSFASLVYGGLHLLAWDAPFPSYGDGIMWRSSGILLASSGLIFALSVLPVFLIILVEDWLDLQSPKTRLGYWCKMLAGLIWFFEVCLFSIFMIVFVFLYVGARGYLVVESFLQLVHLPNSAYALPGWSQYYPHIT